MDPNRFVDLAYVAEASAKFLELPGSSNKDHGVLGLREFQQFWTTVADAQCTPYLTVLIAKLCALERGDVKTALPLVVQLLSRGDALPGEGAKVNKSDKSVDPVQVATLKASLLTTLYFFALYYPFDPHSSSFVTCLRTYTHAVQASAEGMAGSRRSHSGSGDALRPRGGTVSFQAFVAEVSKMLSPQGVGTESIISLVDRCCDITIRSDCDWWDDPTEVDAPFLTPSFTHSFLRYCLARGDPATCNLIFDKTLLFLRHPGISESRLLVLLHMLFIFLVQSGTTHTDILTSAIGVVRQYYVWPRPFGSQARKVLQLLTTELKSPGLALRRSLFSEHPVLRPGYQADETQQQAAPKQPKATHLLDLRASTESFRPVTNMEKTVHVLLDNLSLRAKQLQHMLESCQPPSASVAQLRVNLLANIIGTQLGLPVESLDVHYLYEHELLEAYETALGVLAEALRAPSQQVADELKQRDLAVLRENIAYAAAPRREASEPPTFHVPTYPALAPLDFQFRPVNCNNTAPAVNERPFAKRSSVVMLQDIFGRYKDVVKRMQESFAESGSDTALEQDQKPTVRICIVGGDPILHNISSSWALIKATDGGGPGIGGAVSNMVPGLLDMLDVRFYFIPVDRSEFARYLGTHDVWYGRHVAGLSLATLRTAPSVALGSPSDGLASSPAKGGSIGRATVVQRQHRPTLLSSLSGGISPITNSVPSGGGPFAPTASIQLAEDEDPVMRGAQPPSSGRVLRDELQYFLREAKEKVEVRIWLCECHVASSGASFTLPFMQRCDIGLPANARLFQQAKDLPMDWSTERLIAQKGFKSQAVSMSVKHTQVNLAGQERAGPVLERANYAQVSIASVPLADGEPGGVAADPTQPWLEVSLVDTEASKRRKKTASYIGAEASRTAGVITLHTSSIECETDDKKKAFSILLDGSSYGPFVKIRIFKCRADANGATSTSSSSSQSHDQLTMPFMTFLPIQRN